MPLRRRQFLQSIAIAAAAGPLVLPSRLRASTAANSRVRVGHIGCGRIAREHDMKGVWASRLADYVAVCDLDSKRAGLAEDLISGWYTRDGRTAPDIATYGDYRELLHRSDIDAVIISTPDHQHAELALAAIYAGKDVYLQKPMTMTVEEGIRLRDDIGKTDRIFQLGSQQRSWGPNEQFRKAVECVRSGRVGRLQRVEIGLPVDPTAPDNPEEPVPVNLNYEAWLGPTPLAYYTEQRVHPQSGFSRPGWLRHEAHCLGMITGWGAHHFDVAHWGMNCELGGPSRIEATAEFPPNKIWNVHGHFRAELKYPNDVTVVATDRAPNGIRFIGDEGWIFCTREGTATTSDPFRPAQGLKPLDASDPKLLNPEGLTVQLPHSLEHHLNWLRCVQSRQTPLVPAPIAHRSNTACILSWIAMKLNRPLQWDVAAERFVDDSKADAMLSLPERSPHGIHYLRA
ncbi:MAG TPA: Gfo/Idh/MocA family oxidoreductase [Opitutaceae bacterium]|jgi:predicted dehydrogenase